MHQVKNYQFLNVCCRNTNYVYLSIMQGRRTYHMEQIALTREDVQNFITLVLCRNKMICFFESSLGHWSIEILLWGLECIVNCQNACLHFKPPKSNVLLQVWDSLPKTSDTTKITNEVWTYFMTSHYYNPPNWWICSFV